jgi:DMSO reductase anchor subunit
MPLVWFTALGIAGGGIGAAKLLTAVLLGSAPSLTGWEALVLCALLGGGLLLSAGHLGRPLRGPLAFRGIARSALSREILTLAVTLAGGAVGAAFSSTPLLGWGSGVVVGFGSVAFLLAVGDVYALPNQLAWRGPVALHPLVLGLAWGLLFLLGSSGTPMPSSLLPALWVTLLADTTLVGYRILVAGRRGGDGELSHPGAFRLRGGLWGLRLGLSAMATPLAFGAGRWGLALVCLSLAVLLDRWTFYALAFRATTESEVARVEALL